MTWILLLLLSNPLGGPLGTGLPTGDAAAELIGWLIRQRSPQAKEQRIQALLREQEMVHLDGGVRSAARRFGALLMDPAFSGLRKTPAYDNVRYYLAGALAQQGATGRARQILLELISAKPESGFRAVAFRKLVDLSLSSGQTEQTLQALNQLSFSPRDYEEDEIAYLKGKALLQLGYREQGLASLASVRRRSRLFASATYLAGVTMVEAGKLDQAEDLFCRLVHQAGEGRSTFFLSEKASQAIEYAWLALARLRHDRGDYRRALDTYARIDPASALSAQARYEEAWSRYRLGDLPAARSRLEDLLVSQAELAERPAAEILLGYTLLGNCRFDEAQSLFGQLGEELRGLNQALEEEALRLGQVPTPVRPWARPSRAEARAKALAASIDDSLSRAQVLAMELIRAARGMGAEAQADRRRKLAERLSGDRARARGLAQRAANLRARLGSAENEQAKLGELRVIAGQLAQVEEQLRPALLRLKAAPPPALPPMPVSGPLPAGYINAERADLGKLIEELAGQAKAAEKLFDTAARVRLNRVTHQVGIWARRAQLGAVDAAIGRKQSLEIEVQNLALGRYPLSLLRELAEAGRLDESMEYWPYDGENWPDEYE